MAPQRIERFEYHHIEQLWSLYQSEWWTTGRTLPDTQRMLGGSDVIVAYEDQGELIGFSRVLTDFVFKAMIFDLIVAPAHRNQGLGSTMMTDIVQHPDLAGVAHFELYALAGMTPFYTRWGFSTDAAGTVLMRRR